MNNTTHTKEPAVNGTERLTAAYSERTAEVLKDHRPDNDRCDATGTPLEDGRDDMDSEEYGRAVAIDQVAAALAEMFSEDATSQRAFVCATFPDDRPAPLETAVTSGN